MISAEPLFSTREENRLCIAGWLLPAMRVLCLGIIDLTLFMTLTVFLLKILCSLWLGGKCLSIRHRKLHAMFVLTFLLNGGLNQMILHCLFLRVFCDACFMYSSLWSKLLCLNAFW